MRVIRILWKHVISRSIGLIPLVIISSSVYVTFVITLLMQKLYLEKAHLYVTENIELSVVIGALALFYVSRCLSGGFIAPLSYVRDLYYDYILTRNVCLSQHDINNTIRLDYYESSTIYNLLVRARQAFTTGALKSSFNSLGSLITIVITLASILTTLYIIHPVLALFSALSILPTLYSHIVYANQFHEMQKRIIEKRRRQEQCVRHIIAKEYCLETRIANAAEYFLDQWQEYRADIEAEEMRVQLRRLCLEAVLSTIKVVCIVAVILASTLFLSQGTLSVGSFSAVIGLLGFMHASTSAFIRMVGNAYADYKELADVARYYELERNDEPGSRVPAWDSITLRDVSYKYPNRDNYAVRNVNLQIYRGEKIALVGVNGAGKTTLVNVLLGLFRPTQGKVLYGNHDILQVDKSGLYSTMTAIFQDFQIYALPIAENVRFGNVHKDGAKDGIYHALDLAGFNYRKYVAGIDTQVGKEFNGVELSRGESQQVAIARSYYQDEAEIAVIDEPTAALDPIAEAELYRKFMHNVGGKTAIIISHRLGSTKIAERILVMDASEIVEDGTHEELLRKGGLYAQMYTKQAALYERSQ